MQGTAPRSTHDGSPTSALTAGPWLHQDRYVQVVHRYCRTAPRAGTLCTLWLPPLPGPAWSPAARVPSFKSSLGGLRELGMRTGGCLWSCRACGRVCGPLVAFGRAQPQPVVPGPGRPPRLPWGRHHSVTRFLANCRAASGELPKALDLRTPGLPPPTSKSSRTSNFACAFALHQAVPCIPHNAPALAHSSPLPTDLGGLTELWTDIGLRSRGVGGGGGACHNC